MATNKNALIRYRTIDRCLQNRSRKWTLQDLIDACSDALYEYEGKDVMVSKRTVQLDIQTLRSDKLGYNAPIVVVGKKHYTYDDPDYSITRSAVSDLDMQVLTESMEVLGQFKEFALFEELQGMIQKIQDKVRTQIDNGPPIIHIDKVNDLKGIEHIETLYQAIRKEIVIDLVYQSFTARKSSTYTIHPYILKEYNNRWFLIGRPDKKERVLTLAIDRILEIHPNLDIDYKRGDFNPEQYYKNTFGITVLNEHQLKKIKIRVDALNAPYVRTKPIHPSQKVEEELEDRSIIISLYVHHNYEIERLILGFAEGMEVISPADVRRKIRGKLKKALSSYQ